MRQLFPLLSLLQIALLTVLPIAAETPIPPSDTAAAPEAPLQVRLQSSENAAMLVDSTSGNGYTVQILDSAGMPVVDAAVALRLPEEGPSGVFADGAKSAVIYTDLRGQARFTQIHWNTIAGSALIRVTVVKGNARAGALIQQSLIGKTSNTAVATSSPAAVMPPIAPPPVVVAVPTTSVPTPTTAGSAPKTNLAVVKPPASAIPPTPGTPALPVAHSGAASLAPPSSSSHAAAPSSANQTVASSTPKVTVANDPAATTGGSVHNGVNTKKWIVVAAVVAGAGLGAALALGGHGGGAAAAPAGLTIGTPTLSVGH